MQNPGKEEVGVNSDFPAIISFERRTGDGIVYIIFGKPTRVGTKPAFNQGRAAERVAPGR
jgi:hypothetical protein